MLEEISERPSSANQSENHRFEQNGGKRPGQKLWDKALSQPTILVFFTKVLPEKQNRNKNKMLWLFAVPNSLTFIKACCRGESLIGRHFSVSFLRLWGQCHTLILSFLGLWVPHNPENAASPAEQRKAATFSRISSPWSQETHSPLSFLGVVMVPPAIQLSCQKPGIHPWLPTSPPHLQTGTTSCLFHFINISIGPRLSFSSRLKSFLSGLLTNPPSY